MLIRVYSPSPLSSFTLSSPPLPLLPALIFLHGGGMAILNLDDYDKFLRVLSECRTPSEAFIIVGVDFRGSLRHKFPSGLHDCFEVKHIQQTFFRIQLSHLHSISDRVFNGLLTMLLDWESIPIRYSLAVIVAEATLLPRAASSPNRETSQTTLPDNFSIVHASPAISSPRIPRSKMECCRKHLRMQCSF